MGKIPFAARAFGLALPWFLTLPSAATAAGIEACDPDPAQTPIRAEVDGKQVGQGIAAPLPGALWAMGVALGLFGALVRRRL